MEAKQQGTTDWAVYKRMEREKRKAEGYVAVTVWAKPEDRDKIRRYARRLEARHPQA